MATMNTGPEGDMFHRDGRKFNNRGGDVHLGNWVEEQAVRQIGETTDHNEENFNMAQTYKYGHAGLTARDGATGDRSKAVPSTAQDSFQDPNNAAQYERYTGDRAAQRTQAARAKALYVFLVGTSTCAPRERVLLHPPTSCAPGS